MKTTSAIQQPRKTNSEAMKRRWADSEYRLNGGFAGKCHTPETRARIGSSLKGNRNAVGGKGRKLTEETKRKISEAKKGLHPSDETKSKLSKANKGRILSDETRERISRGHKGLGMGDKNPMFGKRLSEAEREKLSIARRGRHAGDKHPNWMGGITPLTGTIRRCFEYKQWRLSIFKRDDFTCISCGQVRGDIEADHFPKSFASIFHENNIKSLEEAIACDEFWDASNGRTLCSRCHKATINKRHM